MALEEALYVVQFGDALGGVYRNGGVIVLETGRIYGGDSGYYYVGRYTVDQNKITAEAKVVKHDPNTANVWLDNAQEFTVGLVGHVTSDGITGHMARVDVEGIFPVRMILKEKLP